jgi:O-antigen/teichoic acid export membrane protein
MKENFSRFLAWGADKRSLNVSKNILASLFIQGSSVVIGFFTIRVTLDYLDQTKYGIWLTVSSLLLWFRFFNIGLGNGLRNRLAEALANKNFPLGKIYVSTTYAILTFVILCVALVFFILNHFLDWALILNTDKNLSPELKQLALIVFGFFFLTFVVQIISVVLNADQRPAIANLFGSLGNFLALIVIFLLTKTTRGSLIYVGLAFSIIPLSVMLVASVYFYRNDYKLIAPSINYVRLEHAQNLLSLGSKFFFISIASLVIYESSDLIISHFLGPAEVTPYDNAYSYFSLLLVLFSIIMTPLWSAFTDAWTKNDILWIRSTIHKLTLIWVAISIGGVFLLLISNWFFPFWLGSRVHIPFYLSLGLLIYFITYTYGSIFNTFISGVGKIKLQMYSSYIMAFTFIVLVLILIKVFRLGIISIVIGSIFSNLYGLIVTPIQYHKIINNRATGIWNE